MNLDELRKEFGPKEENPLDQFPSEVEATVANAVTITHIIKPKEAAKMLMGGECRKPLNHAGVNSFSQPHNHTPCEHGVYDCKEQHEHYHLGEWSEYDHVRDRFNDGFVEEMDMATLYWMIGIIMLFIYPLASEMARLANRPLY